MTKRRVVATLLVLGCAPTLAGAASDELAAMAREAGVSERQYRMLIGASSSYAEYRTSYGQLRRQLQRAAMREAREAESFEAVEAVEATKAVVAPHAEAETYALPDER